MTLLSVPYRAVSKLAEQLVRETRLLSPQILSQTRVQYDVFPVHIASSSADDHFSLRHTHTEGIMLSHKIVVP